MIVNPYSRVEWLQLALHFCAIYTIVVGFIILLFQNRSKKYSRKSGRRLLTIPLVSSEILYAIGVLCTSSFVFPKLLSILGTSSVATYGIMCSFTRFALHGGRMGICYFSCALVADVYLSMRHPLSYSKKHYKGIAILGALSCLGIVWYYFSLIRKEIGVSNGFACDLAESSHVIQFNIVETWITSLFSIISIVMFASTFKYLRNGFSTTGNTRYQYLLRISFFTIWYSSIFFASLPLHILRLYSSPQEKVNSDSSWFNIIAIIILIGDTSIAFRGIGLCMYFLTDPPLLSSLKSLLKKIGLFSEKAQQNSIHEPPVLDATTITVPEQNISNNEKRRRKKKYTLDIAEAVRKDMLYCACVGVTTSLRGEGKCINPKTDFNSVFRYKSVKSNGFDFRFTEYCPNVFSTLRSFLQITNKDFKHSFKPESVLNDLVRYNFSTAKGGSFFCFTADRKYIVKTVTQGEKLNLIKILKPLYKHVLKNPNTLINYPIGCYKLHGDKIPFKVLFIIIRNVFDMPPEMEIDARYDLKGSFIDRNSKVHESVKKDCDLKKVFQLNDSDYYDLKRQLGKDAEFFQKLNIMDYSLLLGVHKRKKIFRNKKEGEKIDEPFHRRFKNGILTSDSKYIIYMGIIDILQDYNWSKKMERFLKSTFKRRDKHGISSIPSEEYAFRFKKNLLKHFTRATPNESSA